MVTRHANGDATLQSSRVRAAQRRAARDLTSFRSPNPIRMYYVYIMASYSRCLYTGISRNLVARVGQHRAVADKAAFTARYRVRRLVYYEASEDAMAAIAREKQIKAWTRAKRVALVERANPRWRDLAARWPEIEALPRERRWP